MFALPVLLGHFEILCRTLGRDKRVKWKTEISFIALSDHNRFRSIESMDIIEFLIDEAKFHQLFSGIFYFFILSL